MNERIKQLRESLGLSRAAFGEPLGVSGDVINNLERGRTEKVNERLLRHMCDVYHANYEWLQTGEGEMIRKLSQEEEIEQWVGSIQFKAIQGYKVAMMKRSLIAALTHIKRDETWEELYQVMVEVVNGKTE